MIKISTHPSYHGYGKTKKTTTIFTAHFYIVLIIIGIQLNPQPSIIIHHNKSAEIMESSIVNKSLHKLCVK